MGLDIKTYLKRVSKATGCTEGRYPEADNLIFDFNTQVIGISEKFDARKVSQRRNMIYGLEDKDIMRHFGLNSKEFKVLTCGFINKKMVRGITKDSKTGEFVIDVQYYYDASPKKSKTTTTTTKRKRENTIKSSTTTTTTNKKLVKHTVHIKIPNGAFIEKGVKRMRIIRAIDKYKIRCTCREHKKNPGTCKHVIASLHGLTKKKWFDFYLMIEGRLKSHIKRARRVKNVVLIFDKGSPEAKTHTHIIRYANKKAEDWNEKIGDNVPVHDYKKCMSNRGLRLEVFEYFVQKIKERGVELLREFYDKDTGMGPMIIIDGAKRNCKKIIKIFLTMEKKKRWIDTNNDPFGVINDSDNSDDINDFIEAQDDLDKINEMDHIMALMNANDQHHEKISNNTWKAIVRDDTHKEEMNNIKEGEMTCIHYLKMLHRKRHNDPFNKRNYYIHSEPQSILITSDTDEIMLASLHVATHNTCGKVYVLLDSSYDRRGGAINAINIQRLNRVIKFDIMGSSRRFGLLEFWYLAALSGSDYNDHIFGTNCYFWIEPLFFTPAVKELIKPNKKKNKKSDTLKNKCAVLKHMGIKGSSIGFTMNKPAAVVLDMNNDQTSSSSPISLCVRKNLDAIPTLVNIDENNTLCFNESAMIDLMKIAFNFKYKYYTQSNPTRIITNISLSNVFDNYNKPIDKAIKKLDEKTDKDKIKKLNARRIVMYNNNHLKRHRRAIWHFLYSMFGATHPWMVPNSTEYITIETKAGKKIDMPVYGFFRTVDTSGEKKKFKSRVEFSERCCTLPMNDRKIKIHNVPKYMKENLLKFV